jgi:hypothetical protein
MGNLIQNPSCENGVSPWFAFGGSLESSTALVHPGNMHSCHSFNRTGNTGSSFNGPAQEITSVLLPNANYSVSAYALWIPPNLIPDDGGTDAAPGDAGADGGAADAGAQSVFITLKLDCTSNAVDAGIMPSSFIRIAALNNPPEAQWAQVSAGQFSAPACPTGYTRVVTLYLEGPAGGIDLFVDEVTLLAL